MKLLSCPFCGGEALPTAHLTYNWFAPVCGRCNARGPSVKIERDSDPQEMRNLMNQADENWNHRASPASAPEGWKIVPVEPTGEMVDAGIRSLGTADKFRAMLAAAPTPPENKALLEAVAEVVWYDPQLSHFPEKPGKIIDGSIAFMESAEIGTKLFAAPVSSVSEDRKDAELLDYIQNHGATIQIVPMANRTFGFEVGGLHKSRKLSVREAIDAAMQEDKP